MGIGYPEAILLRYCGKKRKFGNTATIGRQSILSSPLVNLAFDIENSIDWGDWHERLFIEKLGSIEVDSYDFSDYEGANKIFDFNEPIITNDVYDTVIDFGSSEHVFNVSESLKNIIRLTKINGTIIHALPANNTCGHGLYQFSPELFLSLYSNGNGFTDTEVFVVNYQKLKVKNVIRLFPIKSGERIRIRTKNEIGLWVITKKIKNVSEISVQQESYQQDWHLEEKIEEHDNNKISKIGNPMSFKVFTIIRSIYRYLGLNEIRHKFTTLMWAYNSRASKYGKRVTIKELLK